MKPEELRIGNYVYFTDFPVKDSLIQLSIEEFKHGDDWFQYFINPIPLSEQWLIDLGFKKWQWCKDCAYIRCNGMYLFLRKRKENWISYFNGIANEGTDKATGSASKFSLRNCPQYVHSIQNLYYALTGKELTFRTTSKQ